MKFNINSVYKFNTLAPSILGEEYTLMKVKSIMSSEEAIKFRDVHMLNKQLLTLIPGLSSNANDNAYVLFENNDGMKVLFANEWINQDSIEVVVNINVRIDIADIDNSDMIIMKTALLELGYKNLVMYTY